MAAANATSAQDAAIPKSMPWSVTIISTLASTVCFAIRKSFALIGKPIRKTLDLASVRLTVITHMRGALRVSPNWMRWTEVRRAEVIGPHAQKFSLKG